MNYVVREGGCFVSISLFEHNQVAYEAALSMLREVGKAAVIHPTGTGKSFIGFQLCADNPDAVICWLSPSEYIFTTQIENLKRASGGFTPDNIRFYTYTKLMLMSTDEIAEINPDYIILDEFHRCGTEMWGQGVRRLLDAYPAAPILGLSATGKKEAVIFDIVNNIENLYSIGAIEQEMQAAINYYRFLGKDEKIINERFRVIDDVREAKALFDKLNDTLTASWDFMYSHAKRYFEEFGNLNVSVQYVTESGVRLGTWICNLTYRKSGIQHSYFIPERIKALDSIGMIWDVPDYLWEENFSACMAY